MASRNVAVVGNSGAGLTALLQRLVRSSWQYRGRRALKVGKSLLINKMRRVRPGEPDWAPTGVKETTLRSRPSLRVLLWVLGYEMCPNNQLLRPSAVLFSTAGEGPIAGRQARVQIDLHHRPQNACHNTTSLNSHPE